MTVSKNDWSDEEYAAAVKGAEEVFKATARVRAVLPWGTSRGDRYVVSGPVLSREGTVDKPTWSAVVSALPGTVVQPPPAPSKPPPEPNPFKEHSDFKLTLQQLGDSDLLDRLARRAAQDVAAGEGRTIFHRIQEGATQIVKYGAWEDFKFVLNRAVEKLQEQNQVGPYVLLMQAQLHSKFRQLVSSNNGRVFLGEALGGELRDAAVAEKGNDGLLISLGVATVELVDTQPLALNVIMQSRDGWTFQLDEWLAVRVIDPTGIVYLESNDKTNLGTVSINNVKDPTSAVRAGGVFTALPNTMNVKGCIEAGTGSHATFLVSAKEHKAELKGGLEGWVEIAGEHPDVHGKITLDY